ncbi:MAG TPA: riboflavin synthase, partial [Gammaproteobacteria bacterium]|nr:riboflavin synthase [Gammaproteobacteria bacterium]
MFTGLVETLGTIQSLQPMGEDLRLIISAPGIPWSDVELGDSIAVNGVCLTVVSFVEQGFAADASTETIN